MTKEELPSLFSFPQNPTKAESEAAKKLYSLLDKYLKSNHPVLLLLSGGTWIPALDKVDMSTLIANKNLNKLTITTLDERVGTDSESNYGKLFSSQNIVSLVKSGADIIKTSSAIGEPVDTFSTKINKALKNYLFNHSQAILVATAGVGGLGNVPGHIAGIEPMEDSNEFSNYFQNPELLYCGYTAKKLQPEPRATATFPLLDKVNDFILLILNSEQKRSSLELILSDNQENLNIAPCTYFHSRKNTFIYTDIPIQ